MGHAEARKSRAAREHHCPLAVAVILVAVVAPPPLAAAGWFVLCDQATGDVVVAQTPGDETHSQLIGPLPGPRTATAWIDANCPSRRCDAAGACLTADASGSSSGEDGGWVAGKLSSVTVGGTPAPSSGPSGEVPSGPVGPREADLTPLIKTATAAAEACSYPAALAAADHMAEFDPEHPWLLANRATLRRLAARQRTCQQAVWKASAALEGGDFKRARQYAMTAADSAVSCQNRAVSDLLTGIETAIEQQRMERRAKRGRVAAALLPGLLDLARVASGGVPAPGARASAIASTAQAAAAASTGSDSCAFQLQYTDPASVVPTCSCAGYAFDMRSFRCVRQ